MKDLHLLEKLKKMPVATEGETDVFDIVDWTEWCGVSYPILNKPLPRVWDADPPPPFGEDKEIKMVSIRDGILKKKKATDSGKDHLRAKKDEEIERMQGELDALEKEREPLTLWEYQQITNCLFGAGALCPEHYLYYHFSHIQENRGGAKLAIRPLYRAADNWANRAFRKVKVECTGLVGGKRRQFGFSWLSANDDVWDILFADGTIFFITKDDDDAEKYFERFNFIHDRLPLFLQRPRDRNALDFKSFFANEKIALVRHYWGLTSSMDVSKAVMRTASHKSLASIAGETATKMKVDEIGEIPNIFDILEIGLPMLNASNSVRRAGCFIGLGTVGNMERSGSQFENLYKKSYVFKFQSVWIPGWLGYMPDENGNDDRKAAEKDIYGQAQGYEKAGFLDQLTAWWQKYPMEEKHMFLKTGVGKLWPIHLIEKARDRITESPPKIRYGLFYRDSITGVIHFDEQEPNPPPHRMPQDHKGWGQVRMFEDAIAKSYPWAYLGGVDPVQDKIDAFKEFQAHNKYIPSDFAWAIFRRAELMGLEGMKPVCEYSGRPDDPYVAYEQLGLGGLYYSDIPAGVYAKFNIERQKAGDLYSFLTMDKEMANIIGYATGITQGLSDSRNDKYGFYSTDIWWDQMIRAGRKYWSENYHKIDSIFFIDDSSNIKEANTDIGVAYLAALQYCLEIENLIKLGKIDSAAKDPNKRYVPISHYSRDTSGRPRSIVHHHNPDIIPPAYRSK